MTSSPLFKSIKATLDNFTIIVPELDLIVTDEQPAITLCALIMEKYPEYKEYSLEVYRNNKLSFTIRSIGYMSDKRIEYDRNGYILRKVS